MEKDEEYYILLQNLQNPKSENFEQANKIITQLIMDQDPNFLQNIINILLNFKLEANESFLALTILKEYFRKSIIFDKFHDSFPRTSYNEDQIQLFQNAAYRFFTSTKSFVRKKAADIYIQVFKTNLVNELTLIPQMIEKLTDGSTQYEEKLTILDCFYLIFTELQLNDIEGKLFIVLLDLLTQFSEKEEFVSLFFKLLSKFCNPIFQLITEKETIDSFIEMTIKLYQEKESLKIDIIEFLQSSCLETENYCIIVEKLLPLIYEDLVNIETISSKIGLSILDFINSDLMYKYPNMVDIFLSQFLNVILNISQFFSLDDSVETFVENEWELFNAAQEIIKCLLTSEIYKKEVKSTIFSSISPFIEEGLVSDDIRFRSVSMNFLSYSMQSIDPKLINQTISDSIVIQSLLQTVESQSCRVRFYASQLLYTSYRFYGLDMAIQFIDYLFKSVFDCESIALNAISTLVEIGMDKKFTLLDQYFSSIQEILTADQLISNSPNLENFSNLLSFPKSHPQYSKPVSQFIITLLEQSLSIPEEQTNQVNLGILHVCCWIFANLIPLHFSDLSEDEIKSIVELCVSIYQRYSIGTDLFIIMCFIVKKPQMFIDHLKSFVEMAVAGISNADCIYSFSHFISFALYLEISFDLSKVCDISLICGFIELFNDTQNFDIKTEIVAAIVQIADMKISLFTDEFISDSIDFLIDLSENVDNIFPIFLKDSFRFYKNVCLLFEKLVELPAFKNNQKSFIIVNQLISSILDYESLFEHISEYLLALYKSFSINYQENLNELVQEQEVYMEKYGMLNQILKQSEAEKNSENESN